MTDEELIESLRLWNRDDAADRIEMLGNQLNLLNELGRAFEEDAGQQRARAEQLAATNKQLEAAIRELKHRWYLGDLQEKDFAAALQGADHE